MNRRRPSEAIDLDFIKSRCRATATGCWLWMGARAGSKTQRGQLTVGHVFDGTRKRSVPVRNYAHIIAWELANSRTKPRNKEVHHICENILCCNPEHLELKVKGKHQSYHGKRRWRDD